MCRKDVRGRCAGRMNSMKCAGCVVASQCSLCGCAAWHPVRLQRAVAGSVARGQHGPCLCALTVIGGKSSTNRGLCAWTCVQACLYHPLYLGQLLYVRCSGQGMRSGAHPEGTPPCCRCGGCASVQACAVDKCCVGAVDRHANGARHRIALGNRRPVKGAALSRRNAASTPMQAHGVLACLHLVQEQVQGRKYGEDHYS